MRRLRTALLLLFGVELWLVLGRGDLRAPSWIIASIVCGIFAGCLSRFWQRRGPQIEPASPRADPTRWSLRWQRVTAAIVALIAAATPLLSAHRTGAALGPRYSDEFSYLLQARMLRCGQLFRESPPSPEHFESLQILAAPKYGSAYFPGLAPPLALVTMLRLPPYSVSLVAFAVAAALLYRVLAYTLGDDLAALLGVAWLLCTPTARDLSVMVFSHLPAFAIGLGAWWLTILWRTRPQRRTVLFAGTLAAWALLTRPVDGVVFLVTAAALVLSAGHFPPKRRLIALAIAVAPSLAAVAFQARLNLAVSGSVQTSAFDVFTTRFYPGSEYGRFDAPGDLQPSTPLELARRQYATDVRPKIDAHSRARLASSWATRHLPMLLAEAIPHSILLILTPLALLRLSRVGAAIAVSLAVYLALLVPYAIVLPHYLLPMMPGMMLLVFGGGATLWRGRPAVRLAMLVTITTLIASRWVARDGVLHVGRESVLRADAAMASIREPAVVLFTHGHVAAGQADLELVVNLDVADPLQARVIRVHDLGDEANAKLLAALAREQVARTVYRYNLGSGELVRIGSTR